MIKRQSIAFDVLVTSSQPCGGDILARRTHFPWILFLKGVHATLIMLRLWDCCYLRINRSMNLGHSVFLESLVWQATTCNLFACKIIGMFGSKHFTNICHWACSKSRLQRASLPLCPESTMRRNFVWYDNPCNRHSVPRWKFIPASYVPRPPLWP